VFPLAEAVLDEQALEWVVHEFTAVEAEQGREASLDVAHAAVGAFAMALARRSGSTADPIPGLEIVVS
jgi:hypothetical protein